MTWPSITLPFFLGIRKARHGDAIMSTPTEDDCQDAFIAPSGLFPVISILKATAEHLYTTQPENERDNMVKSTLQRLDQVNDLCSYVTKKPSIFAAALHRLSKFLDRVVRQEWQGPRPANGLIDTENPRDFVRLYSALQFIFCCSAGKEADDIDIALFGDGFSWGGCILLYLLGHWHRFNFMDFTYWLLIEHGGPRSYRCNRYQDAQEGPEAHARSRNDSHPHCLLAGRALRPPTERAHFLSPSCFRSTQR